MGASLSRQHRQSNGYICCLVMLSFILVRLKNADTFPGIIGRLPERLISRHTCPFPFRPSPDILLGRDEFTKPLCWPSNISPVSEYSCVTCLRPSSGMAWVILYWILDEATRKKKVLNMKSSVLNKPIAQHFLNIRGKYFLSGSCRLSYQLPNL